MSDAPDLASVLPGTARRRYLTVVFSDLSDSTRWAGSMEAEHYADLLGQLRFAYETVVPRHGGVIVRIQGDGMLAIFGFPHTREDDGRRATEAVLELHALVRTLVLDAGRPGEATLSLHSGIHAGLVLLHEGDMVLGRFELLGNTPNIAARLSDEAVHDEVLVSEETLGRESRFFQLGARRELWLKGRPEPIAVRPVLALAPTGAAVEVDIRRAAAPFVGRQQQLSALRQGLHAAMSGSPQYLAVCAPAGVGKTRLVEEFLRYAASLGCQVHRGYCEGHMSAEPLQPFLQMLRALFRIGHTTSPDEAALAVASALGPVDPALRMHQDVLLRALSFDAPAAGARRGPAAEQTIAALRDLFAALAAQRPLVFFADDWHWTDGASRQALLALRDLGRSPILLLVATRGFVPGDATGSDAQRVELTPFDDTEADTAITRLLPRTDPFVAAEIRRYAGGNPLFIEELCHSAAHEDIDRRIVRRHGSAAWLNVLIESRVERLPLVQAELVRAAAVIGNVVPLWLLGDIAGVAQNDQVLRELAEQDIIFPSDGADDDATLRFKHGITRDVIYDSVGLHQRKAMHLRIAEALRQRSATHEEACEALAYHYRAAGQAGDAARFAELAGDKALAVSALDRAQSQYRAALDLLDPSQQGYARWSSIAQRLGLVCAFDPSRDHLDVLNRAVELAAQRDDRAAIAKAEHWLGYIHYGLGDSRAAIHHCESALAAGGAGDDDPLSVQIRATLGQARAAAGDYERAVPLLAEAIAIKRRHRSGARPAVGLAYTLACQGALLADRGHFAQAQAVFDEALDTVRDANHEVEASVLGWRAAAYIWQGRWDDALQTAAEAQRVAERVKSLYIFAMDRALGAYASWSMEASASSLQTLIDATSWLEAGERRLSISLNYGWLADAMTASGRFAEARGYAARALLRARTHDRFGQPMAYRALARASALGHGRPLPQHALALALKAAQGRDSPHEIAVTQLCAARIATDRGDRAAAMEPLDRAQAAFETMQMAWHLAQARALRQGLE